MKPIQLLILIAVLALAVGCASVAPTELVNARAAYQTASAGPAATLVPADLHKAHEALLTAEQSFETDPKSYKTRDLAYVAQRKAQLAGALGAMAVDSAAKAKADANFQETQGDLLKQGKKDVVDAQKRADDAMAELAKLAAIREEERGMVMTLSGSILFQSAQATLMPSAQTKLDQVAKALMAVRERNIVVEGYTDSQGSESYNQGLSQRRADSVRNYLVHQGYPNDRIRAQGMGEGSPVADNASAEGRANNRRVEIVIEREKQASN